MSGQTERNREYTTGLGDYLVIQITGQIGPYIAEVIKTEPLQLKVKENGSFACLEQGDFIISRSNSAEVQRDRNEGTCPFLTRMKSKGIKVVSGLKSLGVPQAGKMYTILPSE